MANMNFKDEHVGALVLIGNQLRKMEPLPPVQNILLFSELEVAFKNLQTHACLGVNHEATEKAAAQLGACVIRFLTEYNEQEGGSNG